MQDDDIDISGARCQGVRDQEVGRNGRAGGGRGKRMEKLKRKTLKISCHSLVKRALGRTAERIRGEGSRGCGRALRPEGPTELRREVVMRR